MDLRFAQATFILVPPDIVAVPRRSPPPVKKRTLWRPRPDGEATERAGARDWFSDRLFVEAQDGHRRAGYGTSITVHVISAIVLIGVLLMRSETLIVHAGAGASLVMPAMFELPAADASLPVSRPIERSAPKAAPHAVAAAPAPPAGQSPPAPLEAPSGITPETGAESGADGVEGGVVGGIVGGIVGGLLEGAPSGGVGSPGPLRAGGGIKRPRKIKDVRPVYPQGALADQARGSVIIEATIGIDGKVQEATVVNSVPSLDQAALDAVRQWEYAPSTLNGVPVVVIMTVIVNFAIQ